MKLTPGKKTPTKRLTAMRAMLRAETPMLAKKKKVKSLQETSKSKIQLRFRNLKVVSLEKTVYEFIEDCLNVEEGK